MMECWSNREVLLGIFVRVSERRTAAVVTFSSAVREMNYTKRNKKICFEFAAATAVTNSAAFSMKRSAQRRHHE